MQTPRTRFDFDRIVDRRGTAAFKWDRYEGRDVIPMWVADMDFPSPPAVIRALAARVAHGVFGYGQAPRELVRVVCTYCRDHYAWPVEPEWIVWLPGLVTGINVCCRMAALPGDDILTFVPAYPPFLSAPPEAGCRLLTTPLVPDAGGRWEIDFEALERARTGRTRLFILCHPHNPAGRVFTAPELTRLAECVLKDDGLICSDEIHCGLILDPGRRHAPLATLSPDIARRTVTLMSASKTFNLAGLYCSFALIPDPALRARFQRAMGRLVPHVNVLGYVATLAAYRDSGDWHTALLAYLRANRDLVVQAVRGMPGMTVNRIEATYLAWVDTRGTGLEDPAAFFEQAGVGLSDGRDFMGEGFVRLNFGCPRSTLSEGLGRMARALKTRG